MSAAQSTENRREQEEPESAMVTGTTLGAPTWDLSNEYPGFDSEEYHQDLSLLQTALEELRARGEQLKPYLAATGVDDDSYKESLPLALELIEKKTKACVILYNVYAYASMTLSVNGEDQQAKKQEDKTQQMFSDFSEALVGLDYYLATLTEEQTETLLADSKASPESFSIRSRQAFYRERMLSVEKERALARFATEAYDMWANQHSAISRSARMSLTVDGEVREVSFSENEEFLSSPDRTLRQSAFEGAHQTWALHREAVVTGLNARTSYNVKVTADRSKRRPHTFFEKACFNNCVDPETIRTMIGVTRANRAMTQEACLLLAKGMNADSYEPWDFLAPIPTELAPSIKSDIPFSEGIQVVREAFARFHSEMGEFVDLCVTQDWIHAEVLPDKQPGAYSWGFEKSGEPRTFVNWTGADPVKRTLAHETGHSLHTWVMRDLHPAQRSYPMTLAETASNNGEMLLGAYEESLAGSNAELLPMLWEDMQAGTAYLLNLPMRFEYDEEIYRRTKEESLTAEEHTEIMTSLHKEWYGDAMKKPNGLFWASKPHFTGSPYYNFPYTFGYLFSLGIYSIIKEQGSDFYPNYIALLRDTGRMSCEDLAAQYLGVDLRQPDFWQRGCDQFRETMTKFEKCLEDK